MADLTFSKITFPGASQTYIRGINASGQVVGSYSDSMGWHGYVQSGGQFTTLSAPGSSATEVTGINDSGQIVGSYRDSTYVTHAFVEYGGEFTTLDVPGASATYIRGISASGQVFGSYFDSASVIHAFVESGGQFTTFNAPGASSTSINGISASGQVFGFYADSTGGHGFVESEGQFTTLDAPGAYGTSVLNISASGQVFGSYRDSADAHSFVEQGGQFTTLDVPGIHITSVSGINASGQIVGYYNDSAGMHGFIESGGEFTTLAIPGSSNNTIIPIGISDTGQAFGAYGDSPGTAHGFILAITDTTPPIVAPSTLTLQVSEDQWVYHPDAQFIVTVDGQQVGDAHTVTALHSAGQTQEVTVTGDFSGAHQVAVQFLNDQYGGAGQDVNLYVHSLSFNGVVQSGSEATLDPTAATQVGSTAQLYKSGSATFNVAPDTLTFRVSEDAWTYHPDAQFMVKVDGQQVGGVLTTHALHSAGAYDDISLKGNFADAHQVTVEFINDQYGGSGQDVNLFIDSISLNGQAIHGSEAVLDGSSGTHVGTSAELFRNGSAVFNVDDLHHVGMLM